VVISINPNERIKKVATADYNGDVSMKECAANARLIAAAPELLEAAIDVDRMLDLGQWTTDQYSRLAKLRSAIAKATATNGITA